MRGADLALDVSGVVTKVEVASGSEVKQGQLLVQLRDDDEVARQRQAEAAAVLAQATYERMKRQLEVKAVSRADYDTAAADLRVKQASVQQAKAIVAQKQLRAPFTGRAGIVTLSAGAFVNAGTPIVTVQQLDPVYVDFNVPQRELGQVHPGQRVLLSLDAFAGRSFEATVTALDPKVDGDTRNVRVEASATNPDGVLVPGMFANVAVDVGEQGRQLTLPQSAITFNPYGETVFIVKPAEKNDAAGKPGCRPRSRPSSPPVASAATRWRSRKASRKAPRWSPAASSNSRTASSCASTTARRRRTIRSETTGTVRRLAALAVRSPAARAGRSEEGQCLPAPGLLAGCAATALTARTADDPQAAQPPSSLRSAAEQQQ